jgi:hypothetical protein
MKFHLLTAITLAAVATLPAHAAVTTDAGSIAAPSAVVDFEAYDGLLTSGPEWVATDVTFTGDAGSELGAAFGRDLGDNGAWGGAGKFAASGFIGELRFTFSGLSAEAGPSWSRPTATTTRSSRPTR